MKRKLALIMAAIMTVAMVPATAFAKTKLEAVDEITVGTDKTFTSRIEMTRDDKVVKVEDTKPFEGTTDVAGHKFAAKSRKGFDVEVTLTNGKFADAEDNNGDTIYLMEQAPTYKGAEDLADAEGVLAIDVKSDTRAVVTLDADIYNKDAENLAKACVLPLIVKSGDAGDVVAKFSSNVTAFGTKSVVIATAQTGKVTIETEGVKTFVEDANYSDKDTKLKEITINELTPDVLKGGTIKLKLSGNYKFTKIDKDALEFLNESDIDADIKFVKDSDNKDKDDEIEITFNKVGKTDEHDAYGFIKNVLTNVSISGIHVEPTKKCKAGDVATITVSSNR